MIKVRVKYDCEHGAKGTEFDVDESKLEAFLSEGKVTVADPDDLGLHARDEMEKAAEKYGLTEADKVPAKVPGKPRTKEKHRR